MTKFDGLQIERDGYHYAVSGADWSGCVIAGACVQAEDAGEYYNPSPFACRCPEREQILRSRSDSGPE